MEAIALIAIVAIAAVIVVVKNKYTGAGSGVAAGQPVVRAAVQNAPAIEAGIDEETVAAIMAAISCMTDSESGTTYAVRSINRAQSGRPAWCFAGMQQNTRPF